MLVVNWLLVGMVKSDIKDFQDKKYSDDKDAHVIWMNYHITCIWFLFFF